LLYWYKSTNTDAEGVSGLAQVARRCRFGTQFTCFTGTKVQILTQKALVDHLWAASPAELVLLSLLALLVQQYKF
jgi:hypothetical protein